MKKFGLIGYPVSNSLSPALFKAAYGGVYGYNLIETENFEIAYQRFLNEFDAVNITAPFKETACCKADILSHACKMTGACNVLKKTAEGLYAANTDYSGVLSSLVRNPDINKVKPTAVIIGCGGAGKAAAVATCELGFRTIILNRNRNKALDFASHLMDTNPGYRVQAGSLSQFRRHFKNAGIIIYTLPVRIDHLNTLNKKDIKGSLFRNDRKIILEANYITPAFSSELLKNIMTINPRVTYISGKEWLINQAIEGYEIFTEEKPNIEQMRKVI